MELPMTALTDQSYVSVDDRQARGEEAAKQVTTRTVAAAMVASTFDDTLSASG
jgi:hypothetical protein